MYYHIFSGYQDYAKMLTIQEDLRNKVIAGELEEGVFLFLEHNPVYTLGIRGKREHILMRQDEMEKRGIAVFKTKRGGDITYHGPGQLVIYPIIDIRKAGFGSVKEFVVWCGEIITSVLKEKHGVSAVWNEKQTGIWANGSKIAAVGMHFRNFVSAHGFAVNIDPDFDNFNGIIPCGIKNCGITSIMKETGKKLSAGDLGVDIINSLKNGLKNKNIREYAI